MRKALEMQQMQEMGQVPELQQMPGEPEDLDGVEVMETGIRHKTAMEAEQVVELVFSQNNYEYIRKLCIESQFDYGISIVKDYEEGRSEEHTSELQSRENLVCRLLLEKKKK